MSDLTWKHDKLYNGSSKKPLAAIEPDPVHPHMWRARMPTGTLSDLCNKIRAKDAAAAAMREAGK